MSVEVIYAILSADSGVTAIAGSEISPLRKEQGVNPPAVTLQRIAVTPQNHLRGFGNLDESRVQVDAWATSYDQARSLANACRTAIQTAGHLMLSEFDNYDPDVDPGLYRITQDYQVWV